MPHCKKGADNEWDEKETNNDTSNAFISLNISLNLYHSGPQDPEM